MKILYQSPPCKLKYRRSTFFRLAAAGWLSAATQGWVQRIAHAITQ
jgi:hypothetical protein